MIDSQSLLGVNQQKLLGLHYLLFSNEILFIH